jgi:hypothetical protein
VVRLTLTQADVPAVRPLRLVDDGEAGVSWDLSSQHGKRVRVARARLTRGPSVPSRRVRAVGPPPAVPHVVPRDSLLRPKKNLLRDGYPGLRAPSRPGRETPLQLPGRSWR